MPGCVYQKETPLIIGLTGGIASGKSTAAETLHSWGAYVIDADKLGHRAYLKDTAAFHAIVDTFGADTVGEDGNLKQYAVDCLQGAKDVGAEGIMVPNFLGTAI